VLVKYFRLNSLISLIGFSSLFYSLITTLSADLYLSMFDLAHSFTITPRLLIMLTMEHNLLLICDMVDISINYTLVLIKLSTVI